MALKALVRERIMEDVIRQVKSQSDWKILVLDCLSVRIISSCCKMKDIIDEGITLVEDLAKSRQPMSQFDVVYFVAPSKDSVDHLIDDFADERKYKYVHIFFTDSCPDPLFKLIGQNTVAKYIKTMKEVNVAFLPYESQVFTLDSPDAFEYIYSPSQADKRDKVLERIAEQLSTLCAVLGEYPSIRYRQEGERSLLLAQLLLTKLDAFKADNPTMGEGPDKSRSQLIILDRGFDLVSTLVHELTYQAMVQDLLPIENDVYKYESQQHQGCLEKQVLLDEDDELWLAFRHDHIAEVSQKVTKHLKDFAKEKRMDSGEKTTMRDLANMLKKMPQYQKELSKYSTHLHMAEDCMKQYTDRVDKLCKVEQDLATGEDVTGNPIKDQMKGVVQIIVDENLKAMDKIRVILLHILSKNGISAESLTKMVERSGLSELHSSIIQNVACLGIPVITDSSNKKRSGPKFERREHEAKYQLSRWTPMVKDVMQMAIEDKLDQRIFPFLSGRGTGAGSTAVRSARYHWHKDKGPSGPRLIVFVIGGMTFSEMRCAYQVTNELRGKGDKLEVLIGSNSTMAPVLLLESLEHLNRPVQSEMENY